MARARDWAGAGSGYTCFVHCFAALSLRMRSTCCVHGLVRAMMIQLLRASLCFVFVAKVSMHEHAIKVQGLVAFARRPPGRSPSSGDRRRHFAGGPSPSQFLRVLVVAVVGGGL